MMNLPSFDLDAPIIPKTSAAGFSLGQRLEEMEHLLPLSKVEKVQSGFNAVQASQENSGLLYLQFDGWSSLEYQHQTVRLSFNSNGELSCIWLFAGYRGNFLEKVGIGSSVHDLKNLMPIFYDDGDEMFYPDWEGHQDLPHGIAFVAAEHPEKNSDWIIHGFSVHDYKRF